MATTFNIYSFDVLNQIQNAAIVTLCGANMLQNPFGNAKWFQ